MANFTEDYYPNRTERQLQNKIDTYIEIQRSSGWAELEKIRRRISEKMHTTDTYTFQDCISLFAAIDEKAIENHIRNRV